MHTPLWEEEPSPGSTSGGAALCRRGAPGWDAGIPLQSSMLPIDFCSCHANGTRSLSTVNWEPRTSPLYRWDFLAQPAFPRAQGCWGCGTAGWLLTLAVAGLMQCPGDTVPNTFPDDSPAASVSLLLVLAPDSPLHASEVLPAALQRHKKVSDFVMLLHWQLLPLVSRSGHTLPSGLGAVTLSPSLHDLVSCLGHSKLFLPCNSSVQEGWESVSRGKSP